MIYKIWDKIAVRKSIIKNEDLAAKVKLLNQIALLGAFNCLFLALLAFILDFNLVYSLSMLFNGLLMLVIYATDYQETPFLSFALSSIGLPILNAVFMISMGGHFGEEFIFMILIFLNYMFHENDQERRVIHISSLIAIFSFAKFYLLLKAPLLGKIDFQHDNWLFFLAGIAWLWAVIDFYDQRIKRKKEQQLQLIEKLRQKNQHLQQTTEELEQFTYIASHDLKTPLRSIISFADLANRKLKRMDYESVAHDLEFIRSGAAQLNYLVSDILEYSKIRKLSEAPQSYVDLNKVLHKVIINLGVTIKNKKAQVFSSTLPSYYCSEAKMLVVFQNLIENAIKYNHKTIPTVLINCEIQDDEIQIRFADNGIGIDQKYHEKIFMYFKRLHTPSEYEGTGLGLALCKKIITQLDGEIKLSSAPDKGSNFIVLLPTFASNLVTKT